MGVPKNQRWGCVADRYREGEGIMHLRFSNTIPRACGKWEHGIQSIILELGWWVWKPSLWMEFEGFVEITGGVVRRQLVDAY